MDTTTLPARPTTASWATSMARVAQRIRASLGPAGDPFLSAVADLLDDEAEQAACCPGQSLCPIPQACPSAGYPFVNEEGHRHCPWCTALPAWMDCYEPAAVRLAAAWTECER